MASLYKRTGIYAIVDKVNGFAYVGQTTMNFGDRRDSHFSLLRHGKHACKKMQDDYNEHGAENFEFIVLHDLQEGEDIDELEEKYIKQYRDKGKTYNRIPGGAHQGMKGLHVPDSAKKTIGAKNHNHMLGRKLSEETRKKMSESRKAKFEGLTKEERRELVSPFIKHNGKAKYSDEDVREMRRLHEQEGKPIQEIANKFGASEAYTCNIINYRTRVNV